MLVEANSSTMEEMVSSPIGGKVGAYYVNAFNKLWINSSMGSDLLDLKNTFPDYELWVRLVAIQKEIYWGRGFVRVANFC